MKFSTPSVAAVALASLTLAQAQEVNTTYVSGLITALQASGANFTTLITLASTALNSTAGAALFAGLSGSNKTLFAPIDSAFANVSTDGLDGDAIASILSYHVVNSSVTSIDAEAPAHQLVRSFYNSFELPGNATQPVVLSSIGNVSYVNLATANATIVAGPVAVENLQVYVVDTLLSAPLSLADTATALFPSLAGAITQTGLLDPLAAGPVTIFAPNDAALAAVASAVASLDATTLTTVLGNHVINGTVAYSTLMTGANYTSASGEPFTFASNSSGTFVTSGNATAKVVQSDILISNGVVHLIDSVLVNAASNTTAAADAASSQSSAAAEAATSTGAGGAVGVATTTAAATGSAAATSTAASGAIAATSFSASALGAALLVVMGVVGGAVLV